MIKLPIFLDMDEVICDFCGKLCNTYNAEYSKNLTPDDFKTWSLSDYLVGEGALEIFEREGFFADLKPIEGAVESIQELLEDDYETFLITSPINEHAVFDKYMWVKENLPFFPIRNLILVGNKGDVLSKFKGGILFDDCPEYLTKFRGITICMDKPYNQNIKVDYRVSSWSEFNEIMKDRNDYFYNLRMLNG